MILFLFLVIFSCSADCFKIPDSTKAAECNFDINLLPNNTPLLLNITNTTNIIYPDAGSRLITLNQEASIGLDCPGSTNLLIGQIATGIFAKATCESGWNFNIEGISIDIGEVTCTPRIRSNAVYTGRTCWGNGREIEVDLQISSGDLIQLYTSCFDDVARNVIYSYYKLTKHIGNQITAGTSPTWTEGDFYKLGKTVNNIYPIATHRVTINRQLGLPDDDEKYVSTTGQYFLAKGHLIARTDFIYNAEQMQTFHYINSAPQWQCFNARNWFYFERSLRVYASNNFVDLEVYTGTYGITTLPDKETGEDIEIYLFVDENGNKAMPIPELFWKIAYDPVNKAGIAVLGLNNPHQTNVTKSIICNDIADELTWLTFDRFNLDSGYTYACNIDDLRRAIPSIPQFDVQTILN